MKVTVDGKIYEAQPNETVLQLLWRTGIGVPTLCYDERLKPFGSCFLCVVEVEGRWNAMPSCATKVQDGMVVHTKTDKIKNLRKANLELLLSNHYADCFAPCKVACPAGIDIQGYIAYIADGKYLEALKLIRERNPLPGIIGRVCTHPCEQACRRNLVDTPVSINFLKRYVADMYKDKPELFIPEMKEEKDHKVAIIGAGPAGLSCAYYLRLEGFKPTIYEALPKAGGMLRYGIPEYRLPKERMEEEIDYIRNMGVEIKYNSRLGNDFTINDLKSQGYKSIFLAIGAHKSYGMRVEGEDLDGVISGIDFLREVEMGNAPKIGKNAIVVGGGNTAIDAARTLVRLGAENVYIMYRRTEKEMPADPVEIHAAKEEHIQFRFLTNPVNLIEEGGRVKQIECIQMELGEPDDSGRRRPVPIEGSEFKVDADNVIVAIGQFPDLSCIEDVKDNIQKTRWDTIVADEMSLETDMDDVYTGGDCFTGADTVIQAIAAGKRVAYSILRKYRGQDPKVEERPEKVMNVSKGKLDEIDPAEFADEPKIEREKMPEIEVEQRIKNFEEVDTGFTNEQASRESERCLSCGCLDVFECKLRLYSVHYGAKPDKIIGEEHKFAVDKSNPYIIREQNKCILCGRCVNVCNEISASGALGFINRGFATVVGPALGEPLDKTSCISCGECISACPTGALVEKLPLEQPGPWKVKKHSSICPLCSVGCKIDLNIADNMVVKVTPFKEDSAKQVNLCNKGKFEYTIFNEMSRITEPLIRNNGTVKNLSYDDAYKSVSDKLKGIISNQGADKVGVAIDPSLSNEDIFLSMMLAKQTLETDNVYSLSEKILEDDYAVNTFDSFDETDFILTYMTDPKHDYNPVGIKILSAIKEQNASLNMVTSEDTQLDNYSKGKISISNEASPVILSEMIKYLTNSAGFTYESNQHKNIINNILSKYSMTDDFLKKNKITKDQLEELFKKFVSADKPLFVCDLSKLSKEESILVNALSKMFKKKTNREILILLNDSINFMGTHHMSKLTAEKCGIDVLNLKNIDELFADIDKKKLKGLIIIGSHSFADNEVAKLSSVDYVISVAYNKDSAGKYSQIMLPLNTFAEVDGSCFNSENIKYDFKKSLSPINEISNNNLLLKISQHIKPDTIGLKTDKDVIETVEQGLKSNKSVIFNSK